MNRARIIYNHWRNTDITRTSTHTRKYGVVLHEHSTHARRMNHWKSASKHARFANVNGMNVIRALFMRDIKVGLQKTDVGVCGFEPVLTHKHWRPTRIPGIVTHTRHINYARRLMNNAHRRTDVHPIFLNRSKLKITHKPPSTHICTFNQWRSTFDPPTKYACDARSAQKRKYVRNSCLIRVFSLCDWPFRGTLSAR